MSETTGKETNRALSIFCSNCGASNELEHLTSELRCQNCGHLESVDPSILQDLSAHDHKVDIHLEQTALEKEEADYWKKKVKQAAESTTPKGWLGPILTIVVFSVFPALMVLLFIQLGFLEKDFIRYTPFVSTGGTFVGLIAYFIWYFSRRHTLSISDEQPASSNIGCPECGASRQLRLGETTENCPYCGALLIPDATTRNDMVDVAIEQIRHAEMMTLRAEREFDMSSKDSSVGPAGFVLGMGGAISFITFLGAAARTYLVITGKEEYSHSIIVHWLVGVAIANGVLLIFYKIKRRQKAVAEAVSLLAKSFGGRGLSSQGILEWLNSYWPSPIDSMDMMPGKYHCGGSFVLGGYPILLDLNPQPLTVRHKSWARIFISCIIPGLSDGKVHMGEEGKPIKKQIHSAGYSYRQRKAGFVFLTSDDIVKGLFLPHNIAALATPITTMVRFADAHDGIPAQKIP